MKKDEKPVRGIFERPPKSGVFWINYYVNGKQHREKAGRKSDAIALYQKRKADARRKLKLPELVPGKVITFAHLSQMAVKYAETHLKTVPHYKTKDSILREPFGDRPADSITPQEIDQFLTRHCKTPATANRYRAFISLCYRLGMENGKVQSNPARLVRMRTENNARLRFLTRQEYKKVRAIIARDNPDQVPAFVVSIYTGMRWGEQFSLTWEQVDLKMKMIRLTTTKNGSARNVPLNSVALDALKAQQAKVPHTPGDAVFPRPGPRSDCRWWFIPALVEAKIADYTWHNNRHTFCSWLAIAGVSTKEIQVLAGHKTITMAARYAHLSPEATAAASERLVM
ncbi:MAG: site-specific integrase [Terracidiphilus sp.]|jgi:integrase